MIQFYIRILLFKNGIKNEILKIGYSGGTNGSHLPALSSERRRRRPVWKPEVIQGEQ